MRNLRPGKKRLPGPALLDVTREGQDTPHSPGLSSAQMSLMTSNTPEEEQVQEERNEIKVFNAVYDFV